MAGVTFDTSELDAFAAELGKAGAFTQKGVRGVISKGALNIKKQQQAEMRRSSYFAMIAPTISYDIREVSAFGGGIVEAEIGPVKGGAGSLANIAYFGTSRGGGTVPDPEDALQAEAPRTAKALLDLMAQAI
ncbi:hypothetical protein GCM10009809_42120 [Isoptericola hypogeus]|uniref:HK97 gp10 family phage protein n=1 Tax=Isoptericola hypogeus TaxID=300179 RepID=A0ABN2JZS6_9MICO